MRRFVNKVAAQLPQQQPQEMMQAPQVVDAGMGGYAEGYGNVVPQAGNWSPMNTPQIPNMGMETMPQVQNGGAIQLPQQNPQQIGMGLGSALAGGFSPMRQPMKPKESYTRVSPGVYRNSQGKLVRR